MRGEGGWRGREIEGIDMRVCRALKMDYPVDNLTGNYVIFHDNESLYTGKNKNIIFCLETKCSIIGRRGREVGLGVGGRDSEVYIYYSN